MRKKAKKRSVLESDNLNKFCYCALYSMLGFREEATKLEAELREADRSDSNLLTELAGRLVAYLDLRNEFGVVVANPKGTEELFSKMRSTLRDIVDLTTKLLDPPSEDAVWAPLSRECRLDAESGSYEEGRATGYSRNPFKEIADDNKGQIALAAVCYLLRSHALMFGRRHSLRDANAARVSLNDLFQTYQLGWRLYQNLPNTHQGPSSEGLSSHLDEIIKFNNSPEEAASCPYFVWNLITLSEIQSGNTYKQIGNQDAADKHYRHAQSRFSLLMDTAERDGDPNSEIGVSDVFRHWQLSPTMARVYFERAKILFDRGLFLEALSNQCLCLHVSVLGSHYLEFEKDGPADRLLNKLTDIKIFLEAERAHPLIDKRWVGFKFGDPVCSDALDKELDHGSSSLPQLLTENLCYSYAPLIARVLAAMGFILFTLRNKRVSRGQWDPKQWEVSVANKSKQNEWLQSYFRFDCVWNSRNTENRISAPSMGLYCETLLADAIDDESVCPPITDRSDKKDVFPGRIEHRLALMMRKNSSVDISGGRELDEKEFYETIFTSLTQNIVNLVTVPRRNQNMLMRGGYRYRRNHGDLSRGSVSSGFRHVTDSSPHLDAPATSETGKGADKFVVLRRWQSYNPRIPRHKNQSLRGGGYFLLWSGRGIVIDPGYDFIQNFYDEGFSLEDIDAVIISHSHPDHDDDFSTLTTLIREWNDYHEKIGDPKSRRFLDVFLSASAHAKFSPWLQASSVKVGRVMPLPVLRWDKEEHNPDSGTMRGSNVVLDLLPPQEGATDGSTYYNLGIEVVPAWHDDVISKTSALGLKLHLYDDDRNKVGILGYTGDTGAYGIPLKEDETEDSAYSISTHYRDCDVLLAHLGDVRLRELASVMKVMEPSDKENVLIQLLALQREILLPLGENPLFFRKVEEYLHFLIALNLAPSLIMEMQIESQTNDNPTVQDWFGDFFAKRGYSSFGLNWSDGIEENLLKKILKKHATGRILRDEIWREMATKEIARIIKEDLPKIRNKHNSDSYQLLALVVITSLLEWQYPYHLGIVGIYRMFSSMATSAVAAGKSGRLFIVGELPEELASYRHIIAHWLNMVKVEMPGKRDKKGSRGPRPVSAVTGDIGLHVGLGRDKGDKNVVPKIRCTYCNKNNELILKGGSYHLPSVIYETPIKRAQAAMVYLCSEHEHHPMGQNDAHLPSHFINRLELKNP
ncbi:MAG: MBL fold metallo-hydrolase [bacterium]|nr:MBL fold metallo-hydrolase [bacterium]